MKKDFIVVTPDSGTGNATITIAAEQNTGDARTSKLTISGGGMNRTINVSQVAGDSYDPETAPDGVYIVHTNGKLYPRDKWKTSENNQAVGVGVKSSNHSFIIAPVEKTSILWGGYGTIIYGGCTTTELSMIAAKDYNGKANTDAIVGKLEASSGEYAAKYCRNYTFKNGLKGYLPALGELREVFIWRILVDSCMSLIGGAPLYDSSINNYCKWSSTQFNAYAAWQIDWLNGFAVPEAYKNDSYSRYCARPFTALL